MMAAAGGEDDAGRSEDVEGVETALALQAVESSAGEEGRDSAAPGCDADAAGADAATGAAEAAGDIAPAALEAAAVEMTAQAAEPLPDGVYTIASAIADAARVEIGGASKANGASAQVYADNWTAAQRWFVSSLENGFYKIANVASGKVLDVAGAHVGNGARVQQYDWNQTRAQQWAIEPTPAGYRIYSALSSSYVLDLAAAQTGNGTRVQLYQSNDTAAQRWSLAKVEAVLPDGLYTVASQASGKVLDVSGGSVYNGANVQQYQSNGTAAQGFYLSYDSSNGYYTAIASASGLVLDVSGGADANGANVQLYVPNGTAAQRWAIAGNADGSYTFRSATGGRALDVLAASQSNGANVQLYASNGTAAQRWSVEGGGSWSAAEGVYNIVTAGNQANSLAVRSGSREGGANVQTASTSVSSWSQKWVMARASEGYYTIRNLDSRKVLDVSSASTAAGANVQQYAENGTDAQLWMPELTTGGIVFRSKLDASLVLDIAGGSTSAGANAQTYTRNGTLAQKFRLRSVDAIEDGLTLSLINLGADKALDISGRSGDNGASALLAEADGSISQRFRIVSAGDGAYYLENKSSGKYLDVDTSTRSKVQQWEGRFGADKQWALALDAATGSFTVRSFFADRYLDGTSGALSLQGQSPSDAQRFALQPVHFKLYLDAGHITGQSGYDSGAVGNGYTEAELTSDLTDRILRICRDEYGLDVVDGKTFGISYEKRTAKAVDLGCTAFLSIHFNAVDGSGCLSIVGGPSKRNENSTLFNDIMHPHLVQAMSGLNDNGVSTRGDLAVVNDGRIASTLLEVAFIDVAHDMAVYNSRRDSVARCLAEGVLEASMRGEFN